MKTRLLSLPLRKLASWTPWTTLTHDAPTDAVLAHAAPRKNTQKTNAWTRTDPAPSRAFELFVRIIITSSSTRLDPLDPLDPPFFLFSVRLFPRTHAAWHPMLFHGAQSDKCYYSQSDKCYYAHLAIKAAFAIYCNYVLFGFAFAAAAARGAVKGVEGGYEVYVCRAICVRVFLRSS